MGYQKVQVPITDDKIIVNVDMSLSISKNSTISFTEGDGIGVDTNPVMIKVVNAVAEKAYEGERKIAWMEVYVGEKATQVYGQDTWLPQGTPDTVRDYVVSAKGSLITPVGDGIRSLNVVLHQQLDFYICQRPIRWFESVLSPVKKPGGVDTVIFRENSEDICAGAEWKAGSPEAEKIIKFLIEEMGARKICFTENCGIGTGLVSQEGTKYLVRKALQYAADNDRSSVALVHKDNITKSTEGAFKDWGYEVARDEFGAELLDGGPRMQFKNPETGENAVVKDVIADAMLQQILLCPAKYDVIATLNLNGDYLSNALAAKVGDIGITPGASLSDSAIMFKATHGTTPKHAGQDKVNPGPLILSAEMMLCHVGWIEAADLTIKGTNGAITAKTVTYDLERLMDGMTLLSCSEFGDVMIVKT